MPLLPVKVISRPGEYIRRAFFGFAIIIASACFAAAAVPDQLSELVQRLSDLPSAESARGLLAFIERNPGAIPSVPPHLSHSTPVRKVLLDELMQRTEAVLTSRSSSDVITLKKFANQVFGGTSDPVLMPFSQLLSTAEMAEHYAATGDLEGLVKMRGSVRTPREAAVVNAHVTRLLISQARADIDAGKPDAALAALAQIDPKMRGEKTLDLARESIVNVRRQNRPGADIFSRKEVSQLLDTVSETDPGMKAVLAEIYESSVLALVHAGDARKAADSFSEVIKLRPDPNEANNRLRMAIALNANNDATRSFARGRIGELVRANALGLPEKARLFFRGYYGSTAPRLFTGSLLLLVAIALASFVRPSMFKFRLPQRKPRKKRKQPKPVPGYMRNVQVEREDEYSRLLRAFELPDSANDEDIKRAYRKRMKELHPDAQVAPSPEDVNRFREVQFAYERIMEIRGSWFGGRK